ncbi:DUF6731 family protein [Ignatzschineria sp. LJL83]
MVRKIKIHAFDVIGSYRGNLKNVFESMYSNKNLPIEDNTLLIKRKNFRFEYIEKITHQSAELWYVEFSFLTLTNGLGRGSRQTKMSSINLNNKIGEQFCYDTGLLYDPNKNIVIVQYNHTGPRISQIQEYLQKYYTKNAEKFLDIDFTPVLKSNVLDKLEKGKNVLTKIELNINRSKITNKNKDITNTLNAYCDRDDKFKFEISSSQRKGKISSAAEKTYNKFKGLLKTDGSGIDTFKVSVLNEDKSIELLDLVKARLVKEEEVETDISGLYDTTSRKNATIRAYQSWIKEGEIK